MQRKHGNLIEVDKRIEKNKQHTRLKTNGLHINNKAQCVILLDQVNYKMFTNHFSKSLA